LLFLSQINCFSDYLIQPVYTRIFSCFYPKFNNFLKTIFPNVLLALFTDTYIVISCEISDYLFKSVYTKIFSCFYPKFKNFLKKTFFFIVLRSPIRRYFYCNFLRDLRLLKGTVSRDFRPSVFFVNLSPLCP
jgi:hypothetical protein